MVDSAADVAARAKALGKPCAVVLFSGRPLTVAPLVHDSDAVIAAWFLGCEAGNALADVVLGKVSPSGRTVISWPRSVGQIPVFHSERRSGRPANPDDRFTSKYLDCPNEPLFAFGHGLTYGRFRYSNLRVTPAAATVRDTIQVLVDLTNEGIVSARETVLVFTHDVVASVSPPLLKLAGFARFINFDRRGLGLSDPLLVGGAPPLEQQVADVLAVMDTVGRAEAAGTEDSSPPITLIVGPSEAGVR